jgi:maltose alpha-D-glucosyltransferase / alpha-amylase
MASFAAWPDVVQQADFRTHLCQNLLPPYLNTCRWFAGKARPQEAFEVRTALPLGSGDTQSWLLIVAVNYAEGPSEFYQVPVAFQAASAAADLPNKARIAELTLGQQEGYLIDGQYDTDFRKNLFEQMCQSAQLEVPGGTLAFARGRGLDTSDAPAQVTSRVLPVDSSNSAMIFNETYFLKLYRKLFSETNPEVDMVSFLTQHSDFAHIPAYAGSFAWQRPEQPDVTLGMMQRMVNNQQDSWGMTGDYLNDFMKAVPQGLFSVKEEVFDLVALLGQRTGEMHLGLYAPQATADFKAEKFTPEYRQFLKKRFEDLLEKRYNLLVENYLKLDEPSQKLAWIFMESAEMIEDFVQEILTRPLESMRIRIHGDYHLGQVLATGQDYIIIDFEGEPESTIADRKIKHSPLKDVAGMIRSYHYAVCAKLFTADETKDIAPEKIQTVSDRWYKLIKDTYLEAYFDTFGQVDGDPHPLFKSNSETNFLLLFYLLEKAVYELGYEISYRPTWVKIPLKGIVDVIREVEKLRRS